MDIFPPTQAKLQDAMEGGSGTKPTQKTPGKVLILPPDSTSLGKQQDQKQSMAG